MLKKIKDDNWKTKHRMKNFQNSNGGRRIEKKKKGNWKYSRNKREILEIKNKITEMKNTTENFKSKISKKAEEKWEQNIK